MKARHYVIVFFMGMAWASVVAGACAPNAKPGTMPARTDTVQQVGEYLGSTPSDGFNTVSVWRFSDGHVVCYITRAGNSGGVACLRDEVGR